MEGAADGRRMGNLVRVIEPIPTGSGPDWITNYTYDDARASDGREHAAEHRDADAARSGTRGAT